MKQYSIVEILGDGISAELSESVHRVAGTLPFGLDFRQVDLSLEERARDKEAAYGACQEAMSELRVGLKYPTVTREESPNARLREFCDFAVIHRSVLTFPGVENNFKRTLESHSVSREHRTEDEIIQEFHFDNNVEIRIRKHQ